MFGFMKKPTEKEKEEKERKKREKKEKKEKKKNERAMTPEELARLEEVRRGVYAKQYPGGQNGREASITPSESSESVASSQDGGELTYTTTTQVELSKPGKVPPPTQPKPQRGILKGRSNYGPEIPNHGVRGNLDDTSTLVENTNLNEVLPGELGVDEEGEGEEEEQEQEPQESTKKQRKPRSVKSMVGQLEGSFDDDSLTQIQHVTGSISARTPQTRVVVSSTQGSPQVLTETPERNVTTLELIPASASDKTYDNIDLQLPSVAPPRCPKARELDLKRQPAGDFGFTLRRGTVLQRGIGDNTEKKRTVIFAEPGPKNLTTGLLPGDRLIEVNGSNVEGASREDIISLIRQSGSVVRLKVQPIPELSELSMRTGLEGEDVMIHEQATRTGTLQRSGSMRYKSQTARSEAQVASERAWLSAERVWLVHKGGFAAARQLKAREGTEDLPDGKCKVKVEHGGEVLDVDEEDVEKANPPQFDRVEDLATLRYLNESSILHTLRQRYGSNLIHSYAGQALVIVNPMHPLSIYSEKVIQMFRGCKPEDMPPHIYATAQIAYRNMLNTRRDQSIVFMGRSGSGKTTNARHVLHYYTVAAGSVNQILSVEKLNAMFTLLDAFGNSRTILNTSATRFTQITSLDFDHAGQIAAASIQVLMLERNRIARRPEGEPTFHVFYQMLAGIDSIVRKELQLENLNEPNLFMTPLQRTEDRQRATQAWSKIHHSMSVMGLSTAEIKAILCVLAAIYHMGVAGAVKGPNNKYQFARPAAAQKAAVCLGTTLEELARNIFSPPKQVLSRGSFRGTLERDKEKSAPPEHVPGMEALEGFVVGLYAELFNALVALINRSLSSNIRTVSSLLILDTPGIQNPASCGRMSGAGFEDFCHNYIQERLQLLFHETVFTSPQDLYSQENVECDFDMVTSSPAPLVQLIDRASQQSLVRSPGRDKEIDHRGILWLLDEEAIVQGSNDDTFLGRVLQHHISVPEKKDSLLKQGNQKGTIILNHFQGTAPVQYAVKGWLKASRENPIARNALIFLQESHKEEVAGLFLSMRGSGGTVSGSVVGMEGSSSLRRASSIRRSYTTGTAALKRKSICLQVKFQMDSVIDTIRRSRMHFIHCVLPQHNAGLCDLKASLMPPNKANTTEDIMLNVPLVRAQLRGAEMVEALRMYRQGYPEHMQFADFRQRFECLAAPDARPTGPVVDEKLAVQQLLEHLELEQSSYRLGLSQVFFRAGGMAQLEEAREEKITGTIVGVQAHCRGWLARQKLKKLKLQNIAASCIQRNVRKLMAIREWNWWRLYTKIIPLLDIHRTEEELKNKNVELEQLRLKCDRLEKERGDYKQSSDRLETKLTELSADLSEEHTTSSHATEIIEQETSNRLRLEKDLRDIQTKFGHLQRKHEQTEMDLIDARMLAASFDDFDEDEVDGDDGIYRERYERMRRELEFTKKKQQQQHEEELENQETVRQKLERKLADSGIEGEEQQRQISNLKRKSQRLTGEMNDIRRHLEEQSGRNTDLEKKQRKFDSEISKINQQLKEERDLREKIQKERDALITEKFSLEQDFKTAKMDAEFASDKIVRMEAELCDMSSVKTDDKEGVTLKRHKNELERKVLDQEEELDEQAGTIQQLEQAKLRLEMAMEKIRQDHLRELEENEVEMEDMRGSAQKKLRALEVQLEEEHDDRQNILKEKRDLEWKLKNVSEATPSRDRDVEKRLRRDLKRTKSLLSDAQLLLEKHKEGAGSRNTIKQLRNQLEDVEYAKSAAVKARKGVEMEVVELQQQIDDMSKHKQEAESRCLQLGREKNDLQTALEDNEEETNELLKKYKALVQQQSIDCQTIQDQSKQIEEMQREIQVLKEQAAELQSRMDFMTENMVDKQMLVRLEAKIRDLESRLQLEQTTKARVESLLAKSKEISERLTEEHSGLRESSSKDEENVRQLTRQLRDLKEEYSELERREGDSTQRKADLEKKVESLEADYEQGQTDLRLAFKRISDLQTALEADMEFSDDSELGSDALSDEDDDLDDSLVSPRYSRMASLGSGDAHHTNTSQEIMAES